MIYHFDQKNSIFILFLIPLNVVYWRERHSAMVGLKQGRSFEGSKAENSEFQNKTKIGLASALI